jgi:hypothetical protein
MKFRSTLIALAIVAALPAHALYPQWVRTQAAYAYDIRSRASADFNGDGKTDLVTRSANHVIYFWPMPGDGTFPTVAPAVYTGSYLTDMAVADATGDGKVDLIASDTATNSVVVVPSNGDGTFGTPIVSALPIAPTSIQVADFNRDGKADLALRSYSSGVAAIYAGDGAGHFSSRLWQIEITGVAKMVAGDLDGDGNTDLVFLRTQYDLYFGRGDGTFPPPVTIASAAEAYGVLLADLDRDGDAEIISADFNARTVSVIVNNGSRTFSAIVPYPVGNAAPSGDPLDVVAGDFTGDGKVDIVASLANSRSLVTLPGNGNGSLGAPVYSTVPRWNSSTGFLPHYFAPGDFDGDGRVDLVVDELYGVALFRNATGDATLTVHSQYPTISTGQTVRFDLTFTPASSYYPYYQTGPYATGTVTLKDGATVIGTATLQDHAATIEVSSLGAGTHQITASFPGDDAYSPVTSTAVTQTVTAQKTTVTLTSSVAGTAVSYADQWALTATVTSPIDTPLNGSFWLYTDGVRSANTHSGPTTSWTLARTTPGTHEYYVTFEGTATQPPGKSNVVVQQAKKAQSVTTIQTYGSSVHVIRYGEHPELRVELSSEPWGEVPGGNVHLYDGTTLLATIVADNRCCSGGMSVYFTLPLLAAGTHYVRAVYDGNSNFEPSQSAFTRYDVLPAGGFALSVYASPTAMVAAGSYTLPSGGHYDVYRRIGNGAWMKVLATSYSSYNDYDVAPLTVYAYRMEAFDQSNVKIAESNVDMAMRISFTDTPLLPSTTVKAKHVKELVDAVNAVRTAAGLTSISVTDAAVGQRVQMTHLTRLRNGLNEARAVFGAAAIAFAADGTVVRASHLQDLRNALQ